MDISIDDGPACVNGRCAGGYVPQAWVPRDFAPTEILPVRLWPKADSARWWLGTILRRAMYGHGDDAGFVRLSSRVLRETIGQRVWPQMQAALADHIETIPHVEGVRCRGYRLNFAGEARRVPLREPGLVEQLEARHLEWQRAQEYRLQPVHRALQAIQQRHLSVSSDVETALALLPDQTRIIQSAIVRAIRERRAGFTISTTGRVFNAITAMRRNLRQYVRIDGEPIVGVDVRSAQPALLGVLCAPSNGLKGASPYSMLSSTTPSLCCMRGRLWRAGWMPGPDAFEFAELASSGVLYEVLLSHCDLCGISRPSDDARSWVKRRFLVDVLNYLPGHGLPPVARVVRNVWPSVFSFVQAVNANGRALIGTLQRLESRVVIETVAPKLVDRVPIMTLHDAIYSRPGDVLAVREAFYGAFEELGLQLSLKEE